jgi:predicted RNA binding protein YcfA (HicA-like mRNA interferase family)
VLKHLQYREFKNQVGFVPIDPRELAKKQAIESMKRQAEERD